MADIYRGVYSRLKDSSLILKDRLKLLHFAWKSSQVIIPNKRQTLINLISSYLINKKKYQLTEDDESLVWKYMQELLEASRVQTVNSSGHAVVLRHSFCQLILNKLAVYASQKSALDNHLSAVIGCCQATMASSSLSQVFTAKMEHMVDLLASLCRILINLMKKVEPQTVLCSAVIRLLHLTADKFTKLQRPAANQNKVLQLVLNKLVHLILMMREIQSHDTVSMEMNSVNLTSVDLKGIADKLILVMERCFFHIDLMESYSTYLSAFYGEAENKPNPPKILENLFQTLSASEFVCLYVPAFYRGFVDAGGRQINPVTVHRMFLHCCHLIGLKLNDSAPMWLEEALVKIKGVKRLLEVVQERDLYNVSQDNANQGRQLQCFKRLANILLHLENLTPNWFPCFTILLQLNQHILETSLVELLSRGWICLSEQEYDVLEPELDAFLQELITTYQKLRQVPKLMTRILEAFNKQPPSHSFRIPRNFLKRYGEITQGLPQGMTVDVWRLFLSNIKENYMTPSNQNAGGLQAVGVLLHQYLYHVKLADYTTTDITAKHVNNLMVTMETEIMAPMLRQCLSETESFDFLVPTLLLCEVWGELSQMLALYAVNRASSFTGDTVSHPPDLGRLHGYLTSKEWRKVCDLVTRSNDDKLKYIWDRLMIQKLRTVLVSKEQSDVKATSVAMEVLIDLPSEVSTVTMNQTWDETIYNISKDNSVLVKLSALVSNMDIILMVADDGHMEKIATFILDILEHQEALGDPGTLLGYTDLLLRSSCMEEFPSFHRHLVQSVWRHICGSFQQERKSPKKRKSGVTVLKQVLTSLSDLDVNLESGDTSNFAKNLSDWVTVTYPIPLQIPWQQILRYLQVLSSLPLQDLPLTDRGRCVAGLVCVLKALQLSKPDQTGQSWITTGSIQLNAVVDCCVELLTLLVVSRGIVSLLRQEEMYLQWLMEFHSWCASSFDLDLQNKVSLLVDIWCHVTVRNFESLKVIQPLIQQILQQLDTDGAISHGLPSVQSQTSFLTVQCVHKELAKLLKQSYIKPDMKDIIHQNFMMLSSAAVQNINCLKVRPNDFSKCCHLIGCYVVVMTTSKLEQTSEMRTSLHRKLPEMIDWCMLVLQLPQNSSVSSHQMAALHFLYIVCTHSKDLGDALTADLKHTVWTVLVSCLKTLLCSQSECSNIATDQSESRSVKIDQSEASMILGGKDGQNGSLYEAVGVEEPMDQSMSRSYSLSFVESLLSGEEPFSVSRPPLKQGRQPSLRRTDVLSQALISATHRQLIFQGKWKDQSLTVILVQLQTVMAALVTSYDLESFKKVINDLLENISVENMTRDVRTVQSAIFVWQQLLQFSLSGEQGKELLAASQNMMTAFQSILQQVSLWRYNAIVMDTVVSILQTQKIMLDCGNSLMSEQMALMALHSCQSVPLEGSTYIPAFHATYEILISLIVYHTDIVLQAVPAYLHCAKRLLLSLTSESSQEKITGRKTVTDDLIGCAYRMEKLFTLIGSHKADFKKVALYVVSDYVTEVQGVTLLPAVKRALLPAVYAMLGLCDTNAVSVLRTTLSHGVLEVFKHLYNDYVKYHKYTGRV